MSGRSGFAQRYGAQPWHLLVLLGCFALSGYAVSQVLPQTAAVIRIAIWFVGAAVAWDLVLGPLLALADRALRPLLRVRPRGVPLLNYVRVPALLSALLLLLWAPLVLTRSEDIYRVKAGLSQSVYLGRWVAVSLALFALSGLVWLLRLARAR